MTINATGLISIIVLTAALLAGCAQGPSPTGLGLVTNVKGPLMATGLTGTKTGTACAQSFLGLVNIGDASISHAKMVANINNVASVDYSTVGSFPFYGKSCVIVVGS